MLAYDPDICIAIEPKPNEPMDHAYIPTTGHAIALAAMCSDPSRVGVNIESAHAILAGLDPSDEMGFALAADKLWTVHLNDQNGLKFDQDKSFGSADLRRAFNQVRILDRYNYGQQGEYVGLDVKAMRTQKFPAVEHLVNSRKIFMRLLEISRGLNEKRIRPPRTSRAQRDYESLVFLPDQTYWRINPPSPAVAAYGVRHADSGCSSALSLPHGLQRNAVITALKNPVPDCSGAVCGLRSATQLSPLQKNSAKQYPLQHPGDMPSKLPCIALSLAIITGWPARAETPTLSAR